MENQLKALLVEDDKLAQLIEKTLLTKQGINVDTSETGNEAISSFANNQYEIVVLDLGLPDIDGTQVAKKIRRLEAKKKDHHTLIVAVTAHTEKNRSAECKTAGIDYFIEKPLKTENIQQLIDYLQLDKILDPAVLSKYRDNNQPEESMHYIQNVLRSFPKELKELETRFENQDKTSWSDKNAFLDENSFMFLLNRIQGLLMYLGAFKAIEASNTFCNAINSQASLETLRQLFDNFKAELQKLQEIKASSFEAWIKCHH